MSTPLENQPDFTDLPEDMWVEILACKRHICESKEMPKILLPSERGDDEDLSTKRYELVRYWCEREEYELKFKDMLSLAATNKTFRKRVLQCNYFWRAELLSQYNQSSTGNSKTHGTFCNLVATAFGAIADGQRNMIIKTQPLSHTHAVSNDDACAGIVEGPVYLDRKDYAAHLADMLNAWLRSHFYKAQYTNPSLPNGAKAGFVIASCAHVFRGASIWYDLLTFGGRASVGYRSYMDSYTSVNVKAASELYRNVTNEAHETDALILADPTHPILRTTTRPIGAWARRCIIAGSADAALDDLLKTLSRATHAEHLDARSVVYRTCADFKCSQTFPAIRGIGVRILGNLDGDTERFCSYWCIARSAIFSDFNIPCAGCDTSMGLNDAFGFTKDNSRAILNLSKHREYGGVVVRSHEGLRLMAILFSQYRTTALMQDPDGYYFTLSTLPGSTPPHASSFTNAEWDLRLEEFSSSDLTADTGVGYGQAPFTDVRPQIAARLNHDFARGRDERSAANDMIYVYCSHNCMNGRDPTRCANYKCNKVLHPEFASASLECAEVLFCRAEDGSRQHRAYVCDRVCGALYLQQIAEATRFRHSRKRKLDLSDAISNKRTKHE